VRRASIRRLALALVAGLVLLSGGCGKLRSIADPDSSPSPLSFDWPAAARGPACALIDYGQVAKITGTTFDTAAGAHVDDTYTCAETATGHPLPELSLALSSTKADDLIFRISVVPSGATAVAGLGQVAYVLNVPATGSNGPALEYGWLSAKPRLIVLRYTFPTGTAQPAVDAMAPKLLTLAKKVETY
jgi:hypothetical protein